MAPDVCGRLERVFWNHLHGDYESVRLGVWLYFHVALVIATALIGYAVAEGRLLLAALLVPFPAYYVYRRWEYARPAAGE